MPSIVSTGIGSGLDVNSLVSQIVAAERAPLEARLTRADARLTSEFTAISQLKGALGTFQTALASLRKADDFQLRTVAVSDADAFAAKADSDSAPGSYEIEIRSLATAEQLVSPTFVGGPTTVVGTGTLTIGSGAASFTVTLTPDANTLADLRDAINDAVTNTGVRATLINTTGGARLLLSGTSTGASEVIRVNASGGDGGLAQFERDPPAPSALTVARAAADAVVMVSGFEIRSASNTIDNAIDGIELTLKEAEVGKTMTLDVGNDVSGIRGKLDSFVSAYNSLASVIGRLRSFNPETRAAGPLLGDSMLRSIESQLRRLVTEPVAGIDGQFSTLASMGVTTSVSGTMTVDAARLQSAMNTDPRAIERLFSGTGGLGSRLYTFTEARLAGGAEIATRDSGIAARRKSLDKDRQSLELRITQIQARYLRQFNSLDSVLSQLQQTQKYLTQQLSQAGRTG
jgi:flagellar hook-associated protein 2